MYVEKQENHPQRNPIHNKKLACYPALVTQIRCGGLVEEEHAGGGDALSCVLLSVRQGGRKKLIKHLHWVAPLAYPLGLLIARLVKENMSACCPFFSRSKEQEKKDAHFQLSRDRRWSTLSQSRMTHAFFFGFVVFGDTFCQILVRFSHPTIPNHVRGAFDPYFHYPEPEENHRVPCVCGAVFRIIL
jgi:hypothetical protein